MASTYSPSLRIELIGTGDQSGLWGDTTNNNLGDLIEQAITGVQSIPMTDTDYTLTALNGSVDEARNAVIIMTSIGSLTGSRNVFIPAEEKLYVFKNSTTGGQNLVVKTVGGAGYTVPNGQTAYLYCDGTDCHTSLNYLTSPTLGGTPTAPTATYGTNTTQIATTAFVQAALKALYPVGTVYTNAANATNPATLFGFGTWVEIGAGRVLIGRYCRCAQPRGNFYININFICLRSGACALISNSRWIRLFYGRRPQPSMGWWYSHHQYRIKHDRNLGFDIHDNDNDRCQRRL
jgi:hypothetical protein